MPTTTDLSRRVMKRLAILQSGEQPSAQDVADINAVQASEHAALLDLGHIDWPLDSIPVRCEESWINYIAGKVSPDFGVDTPLVLMRANAAERSLIALSAQAEDLRDNPVTDY